MLAEPCHQVPPRPSEAQHFFELNGKSFQPGGGFYQRCLEAGGPDAQLAYIEATARQAEVIKRHLFELEELVSPLLAPQVMLCSGQQRSATL